MTAEASAHHPRTFTLPVLFAASLAVLALIPCVTPTTAVLYFDADPRSRLGAAAAESWTAIGPTGMAWMHVLTVAVSVLATAVAVLQGARFRWGVCLLAGLGVVAVSGHMGMVGSGWWEDRLHGGAWIAAAAVGVAACHIGAFEPARRWGLALLLAASAVLTLEAAWYVVIEHPASVAFFEANRLEIFASRSIEPDSEAAALYERRLRFSDATGAFGLSNILASVAGALGVMGIVLGLAQFKNAKASKARLGSAIAALIAGVGGLTTVYLTGSKGALVAVTMAIGLAVFGWGLTRLRRDKLKPLIPLAALLLIGLAISAVLLRGAMGPPPPPPEGFVPGAEVQGERSLLFRSQYWSAAARIASQSPVWGSSARGFADLYPSAQDPLNPETVTSAHNVGVDFVAMLGIGGWAWALLLLVWIWSAGRAVGEANKPAAVSPAQDTEPKASGFPDRTTVWTAVAAGLVLFTVTLLVRRATLYLDSVLMWSVAAAGFVAIAAWLGKPGVIKPKAQRLALFAGAAAVLIHNQVEMAFFQTSSMTVLWLIVGLAGSIPNPSRSLALTDDEPDESDNPSHPRNASRRRPAVVIVALGGVILVWMLVYAAGVQRHESAMAGAEKAIRRGDTPTALERLALAQDTAGVDFNALKWRVYFHALEPLPALAQAGRIDQAQRRVTTAIQWVDDVLERHPDTLRLLRIKAAILLGYAEYSKNPSDYKAAETAYELVLIKAPYNMLDRLAWADLAAKRGDTEEAKRRYRQVLELREQKYLDAADPLSAEQLERVKHYISGQ